MKTVGPEAQRDNLRRGLTLSGFRLVLPANDAKNYALSVVSRLQSDLLAGIEVDRDSPESLQRIAHVADALGRARTNARHYGDHSPGLFSVDGVALLPNPEFTHWDLIQFGLPHAGGLSGFRAACSLPESATLDEALCAAGLLECDWAVREIGADKVSLAAYLIGQGVACSQCLDGLTRDRVLPDEESPAALESFFTSNGRAGGVESGLARQAKRAERVRRVVALREQLRRERSTLTGTALMDKISRDSGVPVSTLYVYFREHDSKK